MSFILYHVLSMHFLLTRAYLKSNTNHVVGFHAFLNFGGRRVMFSLYHSRNSKGFIFAIFCNCHKKGPLVLIVQPCSIDLSHKLAILKHIYTRSETPKKMMEHHETLYFLTSLCCHWQCFLLHNHTRKKLLHSLQQSQ